MPGAEGSGRAGPALKSVGPAEPRSQSSPGLSAAEQAGRRCAGGLGAAERTDCAPRGRAVPCAGQPHGWLVFVPQHLGDGCLKPDSHSTLPGKARRRFW